jgi:uncharacterized membrane protein
VSDKEEETEDNGHGATVSNRHLMLLFLGFGTIIIGTIIITIALVLGGGSGSVGGVVFIGPFPIVFGVGPSAQWLIIVSIIIAALMFVLLFVMRRRGHWKSGG